MKVLQHICCTPGCVDIIQKDTNAMRRMQNVVLMLEKKFEVDKRYLMKLSLNLLGLSVGSWSPKISPYNVLHINSIISVRLCMLGGTVRIQMQSNLIWFIERWTHFSTSWHAKICLTLNELLYNVFFSNPHTTSMHQGLTEHGRCCMQYN